METIPATQHGGMTSIGKSCRFQAMTRLLHFLSIFLLGSYSYSESPPDGPYETFYSNGQLKEKGSYKDGKRDGAWEQFYDAGQLKSKGNFNNGEGLLKWFDQEGQWLSTEEWAEGENGERRLDEFDENEQLIQRTYLRDAQPLRTEWFDEEGNLTETEFY